MEEGLSAAGAVAQDPASRGRGRRLVGAVGYPVLALVVFLGLWEGVVRLFHVNPFILPGPGDVVQQLVTWKTTLADYSRVTAAETLLGFAAAVVIGVPLGIGIVFSRRARATVYPLLVASQTVPKVALAPVFLVWFGVGLTSKVTVAFLVAFFPIVISTALGMGSLDPDMVRLFRSMGAGPVRTFLKLRLPAALPSIFAGMKVAMTLAVVGAIVGEFVGADSGLGYFILVQTGQLRTPAVYAGLAVVTLIGIVLYFALEVLERLVSPRRRPAADAVGPTL
jgi:NitT/TauT family transport system permease protein